MYRKFFVYSGKRTEQNKNKEGDKLLDSYMHYIKMDVGICNNFYYIVFKRMKREFFLNFQLNKPFENSLKKFYLVINFKIISNKEKTHL